MGIISDSLRKNIRTIREIDRKLQANEPITMTEAFELGMSLRKINYFAQYCVIHAPDAMRQLGRFNAQNAQQNFNIPDDIEQQLAQWEAGLNDEEADEVFSSLQGQDVIPPFIPDLHEPNSANYLNYVKEVVEGIASFSQHAHLGISEAGFMKVMTDIHSDFMKTSLEQDYVYDPNDQLGSFAYQFAEDPFTQTIRDHSDELDLVDRREFMVDARESLRQRGESDGIPEPLPALSHHQRMARDLLNIQTCPNNAKGLADAVKQSVMDYQKKYFAAGENSRREFPPLAEFLSKARDRVESAVLDRCIDLGEDGDSAFLKGFLDSPVQTMVQHYDNMPRPRNNQDLQQLERCLNSMRVQRDNYAAYRQGKPDRYADFLRDRRQRFDAFLREAVPSFDPARFKRQYQGNVFERALHRTSQEWTDVANYMENWNRIGGNDNLETASDLATNYLRHKFPGVDPKNITTEMCDSLGATGRARSLFCLSVIESADAAKVETMNERIAAYNRKTRELRALVDRPVDFQAQVANDLAADEVQTNDNEIHHDNDIQKDNEIENDNPNVISE